VAALTATAAPALQRAATNFAATVTATPTGSYILGNPQARVQLVEYVSYTCPHCATFSAESAAGLRSRYVAGGNVSVEVRHIVRDPLDMAMAVAAHCGAPDRFFSRHEALMTAQPGLLTRTRALPPATFEAWQAASAETRLRRVADDTGVTAWMRQRGFTADQINSCLADVPMQQQLYTMTTTGTGAGVTHTPFFAVNGTMRGDIGNWAALQTALDTALRPGR
jgi:protein-disulfide isomerase